MISGWVRPRQVYHQLSTFLISITEMQRYIEIAKSPGMSPDSSCQRLLRGWMKLVAPFTPSSVDGVSSHGTSFHKAVEQPEDIPESIFVLLQAVAISGSSDSLLGETALLLSKAWPTIWIWIKYIYHANLRDLPGMIHDAAFARRYQVIGAMLGLLAKHGRNQIIFEIIVNHESEILPMMADMWKGEGTDKFLATQGFQCGIFPSTPAPLIQQKFVAQIIATCGTAQEAVYVACQRVERHLEQKHLNYQAITLDLNFFRFELMETDPSPLVQPMHASSRVAITLMDSWKHAASMSFTGSVEARERLLMICLFSVVMLAQNSPQAYNRIGDMLHRDLFHLLAKSASLVKKSSPIYDAFFDRIACMFHDILSPATVHREILSLTRRCVAAALKRGNLRPLETYPRVRDALLGLQKLLDQRERKVCVDLSYPNLNFLSYLVVFDLVAHHGKMIASLSPAFYERKQFFFLNYVKVGGSTSSMELVDLNERPSFLPFSSDNTLYDEWCQLFHALEGAMPFLVAIPQGGLGAVQVMTATVHIMDYGESTSPGTGDPTEALNIRWLHCKSIHAPELW
ncbi:hypothetical protein FIBSPDRAFT_935996 [Athelia psychrophila]|uniref:Uncharacterized protein n=1 Tax=Athelia psychrophila TaxID=1759441 RepID=A0A166CTH4_9AGAM|nr:hypothetical protein FIBSPDRAFT_935996 [Fibularhizoctonia sp. CBS 109695]